jgi:hypothetical protein
MRLTCSVATLIGLVVAPQALAIDDPYMWGLGLKVGTIVVPGKYPITFPNRVDNFNFIEDGEQAGCVENTTGDLTGDADPCQEPKRDLDADLEPRFHTLTPVKSDISLGADLVYYFEKKYRAGAIVQVDLSKRFYDISIMPRFDVILINDQVDVYAGGALGFGFMKFAGEMGQEALKVPYYPLRAEGGALARWDTVAVQFGIFAQTTVPGNQTYTTSDGVDHESVGTAFSLFSYVSAGIEGTLYFGDFKPPKKKKKGKGKGKGGGGKK